MNVYIKESCLYAVYLYMYTHVSYAYISPCKYNYLIVAIKCKLLCDS